ncbi:MAG: glycosyltransferase family 2 protein [Henriciella sp.]|nr:glycosyltransferase family 2 protein [Henriciella sp.]
MKRTLEAAPFDTILAPTASTASSAVSVITPVYNLSRGFQDTVASLEAQTLQDFEWIIVDDRSDPEHAAALQTACETTALPITLLRHRENHRQGQARNTGFSVARAGFIKFLDADDAIDPEHLEHLLNAAHADPADKRIPFAPTKHVFVERGISTENHSYRTVEPTRDAQLSRLLTAPFLHHCGALFARAAIEDAAGYDPTLATDEDGDLLLRLLQAGWIYEPVPDVFYLYRHHSDLRRVSSDDTAEKIAARRQVGTNVMDAFQLRRKALPAEVRAALCRRFDALAVRNWNSQRAEAQKLLATAREIDPNYVWSGSRLERTVRQIAGIGTAQAVISRLRSIRGVRFH